MPIVWAMLGVVLLDLFDRFERRYAIDRDFHDAIPNAWLSWGVVGDRQGWSTHFAYRYLAIKLPSYSWEYNPVWDGYMMGQRMLTWTGKHGWRVLFVFPR